MKSICKTETKFVWHYKLNQQSHEHVFDDVKVGFPGMEIIFFHILKPFTSLEGWHIKAKDLYIRTTLELKPLVTLQ
jgi:hypothetical protein